MKALHLFAAALFLGMAPALHAQNEIDAGDDEARLVDEDSNNRFWSARMPGGSFLVALDRISSVSMHEYVVDGTQLVREVTVDTNGRAVARFYHVEPVTDSMRQGGVTRVMDRGRELLERAGQRAGADFQDMVHKNYPATTHAATVEYRLHDLAELDAVHGSVTRAWTSGKGRRLTIQ